MEGKWLLLLMSVLVMGWSVNLSSASFGDRYWGWRAFLQAEATSSLAISRAPSSIVLPVHGNVYPIGACNVTLNIGQPPRPYYLDPDTGSDLTWLQCDAPCANCTEAPHLYYRPNHDLVVCKDPLCSSLHPPGAHRCDNPEQCDYGVEYADGGSSLGVLVRDAFHVNITNGIQQAPYLSLGKHYSPGFAELIFDGKSTGIRNLHMVFDSGSSYTYLNSQAYHFLTLWLKRELSARPLKEAPDDRTLPLCWKGRKPFKNIRDAKKYFKPLALRFVIGRKDAAQFELSAEAYLIISSKGNVCLGILNGSEVGLQKNIIGDISMQDKMIIYDNDKQMTGWAPGNCDQLTEDSASGDTA